MLIIHTADVHLDHAFSAAEARAGIAGARREELRAALRRVVDAALALDAAAVTIAGDLFEAERVTHDTIEFLRATFELAAPRKVVIAPGDRDPYDACSPYRHTEWPSNVHIFKEGTPRPLPLGENVVIWGVAQVGPAWRSNPIEGFRAPDGPVNVLLLHSSLRDLPLMEGASLAPLSLADIRAANARFALLGHTRWPQVYPGANPEVAYPGCPEPLSVLDGAFHGCLPISIADGTVFVDYRPTATRRYLSVKVDLEGVDGREDLLARIRAGAPDPDPARCILRVTLTGSIGAAFDLDPRDLELALAREYGAAEVDCEASCAIHAASQAADGSSRGSFIRRLLEERADGAAGARRLARALRVGLSALERTGGATY